MRSIVASSTSFAYAIRNEEQFLRRLSLINEAEDKYVRMTHLASLGSHAINGTAVLHSELLKRTVLRDFHRGSPEKFLNVTNGARGAGTP